MTAAGTTPSATTSGGKGRPLTPEETLTARRHAARITRARQAEEDAMQAAADWLRSIPGRVSEPAAAECIGVNRRTVHSWLAK